MMLGPPCLAFSRPQRPARIADLLGVEPPPRELPEQIVVRRPSAIAAASMGECDDCWYVLLSRISRCSGFHFQPDSTNRFAR